MIGNIYYNKQLSLIKINDHNFFNQLISIILLICRFKLGGGHAGKTNIINCI